MPAPRFARTPRTREKPIVRRGSAVTSLLILAALCGLRADDKEKPFIASPLTKEKEFTEGIEGPACDADGNVYAAEGPNSLTQAGGAFTKYAVK